MDKEDLGLIEKNGELVPVTLAPQELALKDKSVTHRKTDKGKKFSFRYDATSVIKKLTSSYKIQYKLKKRKFKTGEHPNPIIREKFKSQKTICEVRLKIAAFKINIVVQKPTINEAMRSLAFKLHKTYSSKITKK